MIGHLVTLLILFHVVTPNHLSSADFIPTTSFLPTTSAPASDLDKCRIAEYNGFLKYICKFEGSNKTYFRCLGSDIYYSEAPIKWNSRCNKDHAFYQACGMVDVGSHNEFVDEVSVLCNAFYCDRMRGMAQFVPRTPFTILTAENSYENTICDGFKSCTNTDIDEDHCEANDLMNLDHVLLQSNRCNDACSDTMCEDESRCNGVIYGKYCMVNNQDREFVAPAEMCNGVKFCSNGADEANCRWADENGQHCRREGRGYLAIADNLRCFPGYMNCTNYVDQTNCTDHEKVSLRCRVNGYLSTISKHVVCKGKPQLCEDNLENQCEQVTASCLVHKHRICDGTSDCQDNSDETHPACLRKTEHKCQRRGFLNAALPIPYLWLVDGFTDCEEGEDEVRSLWPRCGRGPTLRFRAESSECLNVFLCRGGEAGYVEVDFLCDGVESCGFENHLCSESRNFPDIYTDLSDTIRPSEKQRLGIYHMSFCVIGMARIQDLADNPCIHHEFKVAEDHYLFGVDQQSQESYLLPRVESTCDHVYGENYVFRSCTNACHDSTCPLTVIPKGNSCPMQFHQRVKTYAMGPKRNDPYLAMLWRTRGWFTNRIFVCSNNLKCLPYSKVCDLVADCSDGSDEAACTNHYQCETTSQFIPKTQKCDGVFHCLDLSDECNDECSRELLSGVGKKLTAWVFGCSAMIFNTFAVIRNISTIKESKNMRFMTNKALVLLINLGDLLIGIYLVTVAFMDKSLNDNYCVHQTEWLTDTKCKIIGVLNTIGSQVSLISMTTLSIIRARCVSKSLANKSPNVNTKNKLVLLLKLSGIVLGSVALAIIPIIPTTEDYFVNGLHHDPKYKVFIGFLDKDKHFDVLSRYYGRMQKKTLKWKLIKEMVKNMFTQEYGALKEKKLEFYGNDATCMFKYFVTPSDPQKQFTWSVLALNFSCFIAIAFAYLIILSVSKRSTATLGERFKKRHRATQRKISAIILTDCLCWIPFIVLAMIHSAGLVDATQWYSVFSIIILPINSVINPFIYDHVLSEIVKSTFNKVFKSKTKNINQEINELKDRENGEVQGTSGPESPKETVFMNKTVSADVMQG